MVAIRADANEKIATGHLMRCMSIAEELRDQGEGVLFFVADSYGAELVREKGFDAVMLGSRWDDLDSEMGVLEDNIQKCQVDCMVLDSYYATPSYMERVSRMVRLVYLDDLFMFRYSCSAVVNYSIYAEEMNYDTLESNVRKLLGCKYVPLRREFRHLPPKKIREDVENVLLLTGGSDNCHVALQFCSALKNSDLRNLKDVEFHVVCGRYNGDLSLLEEMERYNPDLTIHWQAGNIAELMRDADIAVSAGGSTLYELCACGTPIVTYSLADNQLRNVRKFDELGLAFYSGDVRENFDYNQLLQKVNLLGCDRKKRQKISAEMQRLVDGQGAERIARYLVGEQNFEEMYAK